MIKVIGKGNISATIIAHSKSAVDGKEIITYELEYHRYIHSECLTHRMWSRNAASSRAIPVSKMIDLVRTSPATPIHWGKNQAGMQASEECNNDVSMDWDYYNDEPVRGTPEDAWAEASSHAMYKAECFNEAGYHKQITNRLLEPFQMIKVVVTATEWDNFFWLRFHKAAQPEIQELARCMLVAKKRSVAEVLQVGEWHTPYVDHWRDDSGGLMYGVKVDKESAYYPIQWLNKEEALRVSASCSAQVSYRKTDDSLEKADKVWQMLTTDERLHCFDDKTEVLTQNGFKLFKDVLEEDFVADVCAKSGKLVGFVKPTAYIRKNYSGEMAYIQTNDLDFRVTIDHTMLGHIRTKSAERASFNLNSFKFSDKTSSKSIKNRMLNVECSVLSAPVVEHSESLLGNLIGMYIGDGFKVGKRMGFRFKKQRKIDYLTDVINKLGLDYYTKIYNGVTLFVIKSHTVVDNIFTTCGVGARNKRIGFWPSSLYISIYEGLRNSDGSNTKNTWSYSTASELLRNDFMSFAPLAGITVFENKQFGTYNLRVKTTNIVLLNDSRKKHSFVQSEEVVNENVYCLTMPSGGLVVRRNNKTLVCGNCSPTEHQATPIDYHYFYDITEMTNFDGITHINKSGKGWSNNFCGWIQHRALIANNNCTSFDYDQEIDETGLVITDNKDSQ